LLSKSIHDKLWPLDDEIIVHPGHGPLTTIGEEKMNNPFVGISSNRGAYNRGRYI
jgi:hydroxyacylglutathione hydrolase